MPSKMPWDKVKAESLRTLCADLGRRLSSRADMINFLNTVEDEGLDAALAVDAPKPKRKAGRPPKNEQGTSGENEPSHPAKRPRRSTGGPTAPVRSARGRRTLENPAGKFDGIELTSNRRLSRQSPQPENEVPYLSDGEAGRAADAAGTATGLEEPENVSPPNHDLEAPVPESIEGSAVVPDTEILSTGADKSVHVSGGDGDGDGEVDTTTENDPNDIQVDPPVDDSPV